MKQILVLEPGDVVRLKGGETLQLTGNLMLSLQGRAKKVNGVQPEGLTKEQLYQRKYRKTYKRKKFACSQCGKTYATPNALGPHQRHCQGKVGAQ